MRDPQLCVFQSLKNEIHTALFYHQLILSLGSFNLNTVLTLIIMRSILEIGLLYRHYIVISTMVTSIMMNVFIGTVHVFPLGVEIFQYKVEFDLIKKFCLYNVSGASEDLLNLREPALPQHTINIILKCI